MTDAPTIEPAPEAPAAEADPPVPETDWKAEAEKLKSEARKWETRSKDNAKAAQRLAEIEEASKTDLEKFQSRAEAAEKRLAEIESREQVASWKSEIAAGTGVPADALRGSTREELEAHAEALKPLLTASQRGPFVPSPGNIPDNPVTDNAAFARALFGSGT
jgi:hypothetical protein